MKLGKVGRIMGLVLVAAAVLVGCKGKEPATEPAWEYLKVRRQEPPRVFEGEQPQLCVVWVVKGDSQGGEWSSYERFETMADLIVLAGQKGWELVYVSPSNLECVLKRRAGQPRLWLWPTTMSEEQYRTNRMIYKTAAEVKAAREKFEAELKGK